MILKCFICFNEINGYVTELRKHIKICHVETLNDILIYKCVEQNCTSDFFNFSNLTRHIRSHHPNTDHVVNINNNEISESEDEILNDIRSLFEFTEEMPLSSLNCYNNDLDLATMLCNKAHGFILQMRGDPTVTIPQIDKAIKLSNEILFLTVDKLKKDVEAYMASEHSESEKQKLLSNFNIVSPFSDVDTKHKQDKMIRRQTTFIEPVEVVLGIREENILKNSIYIKKNVKETFQYISIKKSIEKILNIGNIYEEILNRPLNNDPNSIESFFDSEIYKNHPLFKEFPDTLAIQLYLDDVEVTNPLGSKTKIHKICNFYFTLLNMPAYFNSKLKNINTVLMCHSVDIEKYGYAKIMDPLIKDLKDLESECGVIMTVLDREVVVRGTIVNLSADTLAAHSILGLLAPACNRFCRLCMVLRNDISSTSETTCNFHHEKRTVDNYQKQLTEVIEQPVKKGTEFGIRTESELHKLKYFHLTKNYGLDSMHDMSEGIIMMELRLVLNQFIVKQGLFTVEKLNTRLHSFQYGIREIKNRPSANFTLIDLKSKSSHKLKQKSAQVLCLLRVLPFIISDLLTDFKTNQYMKLIVYLNEIHKIVNSDVVNRGTLDYLETITKEHHELFRELFPKKNFINKHHHIEHYAECIHMFGPLSASNCMRYEGKHNFFKRYAHIINNFRNITKSLCFKEQTNVSNNLINDNICVYSRNRKIDSSCMNLYKDDTIFCHYVKLSDIEYKVNSVICLDIFNDFPQFATVQKIIMHKNKIWISVQKHLTVSYSSTMAAYLVNNIEEFVTMKLSDLKFKTTFSMWTNFVNPQKYVISKSINFN